MIFYTLFTVILGYVILVICKRYKDGAPAEFKKGTTISPKKNNTLEFLIKPKSKIIFKGKNEKLTCRINSTKRLTHVIVYWSFNKNKIILNREIVSTTHATMNYRVNYENYEQMGTYDLHILNVTFENEGQYTCGAEEKTAQSDVTVAAPPGVPTITVHGPVPYAFMGESLTLVCASIGGFPTPTIKWTLSNEYIKSNKDISISNTKLPEKRNGTTSRALFVKKLDETHRGVLIGCIVSLSLMNVSRTLKESRASITMPIHGTPIITMNKTQTIILNGILSIHCKVYSLPTLQSIVWKKDGKTIKTKFIHTIIRNRAAASDAGRYTCYATNAVGTTSAIIDIVLVSSSRSSSSHVVIPLAAITALSLIGLLLLFLKKTLLKTKDDKEKLKEATSQCESENTSASTTTISTTLPENLTSSKSENIKSIGKAGH